MTPGLKMMIGKSILSFIAIITIFSPYLADWNVTHIYNPLWPPHAKFHNAQTMSMGVLLGLSSLYFLWLRRYEISALIAGALFAALYWLSQLPSFLYPGVGWTDPNLLKPGQSMHDIPIQLKGDAVLIPLIVFAFWLIMSAHRQTAAE